MIKQAGISIIGKVLGGSLPSYVTDDFVKSASTLDAPGNEDTQAGLYLTICNGIMEQKSSATELLKKAQDFNIIEDVYQFATKYKDYIKSASLSNYAIHKDGVGYFDVRTKEATMRSMDSFDYEYHKFGTADRVEIARNLQKRAGDFHITMANPITRVYANLTNETYRVKKASLNGDRVRHMMEKRAYQVDQNHVNPIYAEAYMRMAYNEGQHLSSNEDMVKFALDVERLDRQTGLFPYHKNIAISNGRTDVISDPLGELLRCKQAQQDEQIDLGDNTYLESTLISLPASVYKAAFTDDIYSEMASGDKIDTDMIVPIIKSLPNPEKAMLDKEIIKYQKG